jgi:hypothetical protein
MIFKAEPLNTWCEESVARLQSQTQSKLKQNADCGNRCPTLAIKTVHISNHGSQILIMILLITLKAFMINLIA